MGLSSWPDDLPERIDHTLLRPDATKQDISRLCREAQRYGFGVVFVPPCYVEEAIVALRGSAIRIGVPIGFPLGSHTTRTKVLEAVEAYERGARELDMVLNIGLLKSGDHDGVRSDIGEVVRATPEASHKVILETCLLSTPEKRRACRLAVEAGAAYVKTSTGFATGGATVEDVRLMKEAVAGQAKVKASGGIRDLQAVQALLRAGADRIGTSASVTIVEDWLAGKQAEGENSIRPR